MASDIAIVAEEILRTRARLNDLYVTHTGQALADVEKVMDRDTYMTPTEALDFGVIDSVIDRRPPETIGGGDEALAA